MTIYDFCNFLLQFAQTDFMDKTVLTNATIRAMVVTLLMVYAILDANKAGKEITAATVCYTRNFIFNDSTKLNSKVVFGSHLFL